MMKKTIPILVTIGWVLLGSLVSFAAGPGQFSSFTDEEYARLMDNTCEWDEIGNLVTYFNPTYRKYADSAQLTLNDFSMAKDSFKDEMQQSLDAIDENLEQIKVQRDALAVLPAGMIIDPRGTTAGQMIKQLDLTGEMLRQSRTQVRQAVGQASTAVTSLRSTTEKSLKPVREQLQYVVEGLIISYHELLVNRELVEQQISLYETVVGTQKALYAQNLATLSDISKAELDLSNARVTLATVDNGLLQLRTAIGLQLGWSADNPPVIGPVPAPDTAYIASVNKDADYQTALSNSSSYEQTGKVSGYQGYSAVYQRDRAVNEANASFSSKFNELYSGMMSKNMLYAASGTSLERARLSRERAQVMRSLGLTGEAEYQGMQLEYLACEANVRLSALALFQAENDYKWALRGFMTY